MRQAESILKATYDVAFIVIVDMTQQPLFHICATAPQNGRCTAAKQILKQRKSKNNFQAVHIPTQLSRESCQSFKMPLIAI